ncbi:serine/threonine-protein phosphatase 4 regulatory subunit 2 isoform X2 [Phalaenopsis equestris]|uniref:serine/threonine-protein phosphatase 4 regulatory subunit 2 isoform X2 n=1 Tax=Phalaenopsis equestris TaxID=78828 RepID=UPI0009E4EFE7|nr:serine/threonine-protein phosphatase 4 regulatory subunit 2 isoform X2 [Phalaenopsis equestris]
MGAESELTTENKVTEDSLTPTLSSNHEDAEPKLDASPEEIRSILEVIAATGKFWHDWDELKNMLSFQLKQVLAEYPEARVGSDTELQQSTLSGETYPELVKRLDEALLGFIEGPPFTLQRLCEILLNPKSTYRSLSKLALALEKNLLVTSTLTRCNDPYPEAPAKRPTEPNKVIPEEPLDPNENSNGVGNASNDVDEEMVDAEADEEFTSKDADMKEEKTVDDSTENSEKNSEPIPSAEPSSELTS